ncbi:glucose-1-phosphate adenylyltransferase subunit GlgD [Sporolactobacillus sp. STCC-11]|uniref:glucose-1-phosphate adenylyltransferase subunit GlgD n=1 Tax=Sporolactobacillus caesalpiniae TaxID=3230362 RepID=UPI00339B4090
MITNNQKICGVINLSESIDATLPLTEHRPVAGLPFCGRYRLIDFPLSNLASAGADSIGIFMNDRSRSIYDHVRSGSDWDLDGTRGGLFFFTPTIDRPTYGRVKEDLSNYYDNLEFIEKSGADYVLIMGSRMLCNLDVNALLRYHLEQKAAITVVYKKMHRMESSGLRSTSLVFGKDGCVNQIVSEAEQQDDQIAKNMEIYLMNARLFAKLIRCCTAGNDLYRLRDALHQSVSEVPTIGFKYTGYMKNVQSIKAYYDANMDMLKDANRTALLNGNHRISTKIKNEVPAFYGQNAEVSEILLANGCVIHGSVRRSILSRNVSVAAGAKIEGSILMEGCVIGEGACLENVIMDKETYVAPGSKVIGSKLNPIVIEKHQQSV